MAVIPGIFNTLSEKMGAPGSKYFPPVLAAMMSEDEADILLKVPQPTSKEDLAAMVNMSSADLDPVLRSMEERQVIRKAKDGTYIAPGNVVAFHHGAIGWMREDLKEKVYPLWGEFFYNEWRDIILKGFVERYETGAPGAHRVVPLSKALRMSPKVDMEQVLWYEDMEQVLGKASKIMVMMCGCRGLWRKCDDPIDTCIQLEFPWSPPRKPNEYIKPPHYVTIEEAMEVINDCEDRGMVHIPLNTSQGDMYCNCCDDCCMVINPLLNGGRVHDILTPSRYRAVVDEELCTGCGLCEKRCKFDAIRMEPVPGDDKKKRSTVLDEHCLGCGACVVKCPKNAITLELVRPPEHIPTVTPMELFAMQRK